MSTLDEIYDRYKKDAQEDLIRFSKKPLPQLFKEIKDLQFCFDELLGELGWGDEIAETGVDPLAWARNEIKDLHKTIKRLRGSLELRDAANGKCKQCGTLHAEPIIHCDVCGAFQ